MNRLHETHPDLAAASPEEVLLYGLSLDRKEPLIGMVAAVRLELRLLACLMLSAPPVSEIASAELSATLELLSRRLETVEVVSARLRRMEREDAETTADSAVAETTGNATAPLAETMGNATAGVAETTGDAAVPGDPPGEQ